MKNKNLLYFVIIIVLIIVIVWIANNRNDEGESDDEVVKIGVIVPLTGEYTTLGNRIKNGMELARSEIESENDISLKIIYEDVCLGNEAIPAVSKLIEIDGIDWIGASFCVVGLIPNILILEEKKIISFSTPANPDMMLNHPYVFSTNKAIKDDAKELAEFSYNELEAKTVSLIYYNNAFGVDYGKYYKEEFEGLGGEVLLDIAYELNQNDFRTELIKIKNKKPDVIFVIG
ncbi:amino acid ABC transporter substrate-binding protein, partial [Candidatus Pacearchaeota archaeon]|nr:amino acid ABC transporter substrate-binding protein [Candidatus Pacearchaeota archaeon]